MKKNWMMIALAVFLSGCSAVDTDDVVSPAAPCSEVSADFDYAPPARVASAPVKSNSAGAYFQQSDRLMAYQSGFTLSVKEREKALGEVKLLAEKLGGYIVSSRNGYMRLKVPVAKADGFIKSSGAFGKVSNFHISAEDMTDSITDIKVRLDNLRKLRTRLTELLKTAKNVDEMLKVERELNRVTTEIERMDARLKNNQQRVDYVDFTVVVVEESGLMPGGTPLAIDHFNFLNDLASAKRVAGESEPLFDLDLPEGFVVMPGGYARNSFAATSSDDCVFRTWLVYVADNSALDFWEKMICRALQSKKSFDRIKTFPMEFDGRKAVKITAEVTTRRGLESYLAVISIERCWGGDQLQIIELFGPQEAFKKHEEAVLKVLKK